MRERSTPDGGDYNSEVARPVALTWDLTEELRGFFSPKKVETASPSFDLPFYPPHRGRPSASYAGGRLPLRRGARRECGERGDDGPGEHARP